MKAWRLDRYLSLCWRLPLSLCLMVGATNGMAQNADKKAVRALQERVQRLQQTAEQDKTALLGEKAELDRKLLATKADLDRARTQTRRDTGNLKEMEALRQEKETLAMKLGDVERQLAEALSKLDLAGKAKAQEHDTLLIAQRDLQQSNKSLTSCETQNRGLYKLNTDLLERYVKSSSSGTFLNGGVFTQLGRVRTENESTACEERLEDLKVTPKVMP